MAECVKGKAPGGKDRLAFIERPGAAPGGHAARRIATVLQQACRTAVSGLHCAPMSQPRVLMVDDDAELSGLVAELLAREGWALLSVLTGGDGERALTHWRPDVALLDVMLPDANGLDLCRRWRAEHPGLGLVMLTARGEPMDRVLGLEIGADDYLPKPFEPRELVARLRALLRRQRPGQVEASQWRFNGLTVDLLQREVLAGAQAVALTTVEYKLLVALARTPGQALSREQLSQAVQGSGYRPQDRTVDVQVARLRRKLREASPGTEWIDTVRGEGYVFVPRSAP
jgi:DNA-binding response OmpR family regulator